MDLLEKFAPQKKKTPSINQCAEKGGGRGITYPSVLCIEKFRTISFGYN
jgi:hypothetical protein